MAVTVGVDSYINETELADFAANRDISLSGSLSALLIRAMDVIERYDFKGSRTDPLQVLEWPRSGVYVDGVLIDSSVVPNGIKSAQAAQAIGIFEGTDPNSIIGRAVKKEKLGALEVEYMDNASTTPSNPWVDGLLEPYISSASSGGMGFNISVNRV